MNINLVTKYVLFGLAVFTMLSLASCDVFDPKKSKRNFSKHGVYELDMKTFLSDRKRSLDKDQLVRQWRLDIPKKFIYSHRGINGKPSYDPIKDKSNKYSITLFASIDTETKKIIERDNFLKPVPGEKRITYNLLNGQMKKRYVGVETCLTNKERAKIFGAGQGFVCRANLCPVYIYVEGWPVHISLDRELYETDLQLYCEIAKGFLNDITVHRDSQLIGDGYD